MMTIGAYLAIYHGRQTESGGSRFPGWIDLPAEDQTFYRALAAEEMAARGIPIVQA